jgi:hypothetical protein
MARSKQYAQRVNILKKVRVGKAWKLASVVERNGKDRPRSRPHFSL